MIKKRLASLARKLKDNQVDGIIVTSMSNVSYLTGFMGHDAWALVLGKRIWLLTDSRYTEQAKTECPACKIIQRKKTLAEEAANILKRNNSVKKLAIDLDRSVNDLLEEAIEWLLKKYKKRGKK